MKKKIEKLIKKLSKKPYSHGVEMVGLVTENEYRSGIPLDQLKKKERLVFKSAYNQNSQSISLNSNKQNIRELVDLIKNFNLPSIPDPIHYQLEQLALLPMYCITFYKSQSLTIGNIIMRVDES